MSYLVTCSGTIEFENPVTEEDLEKCICGWEISRCGQKGIDLYYFGKFYDDDIMDDLERFASLGVNSLVVDVCGEDYERWRYRWNGKTVVSEVGVVVYVGNDWKKLSYDRILQLFVAYVNNDYEDVSSGGGIHLIYEKLKRIGCKDEELKATGLDWIIREEEKL